MYVLSTQMCIAKLKYLQANRLAAGQMINMIMAARLWHENLKQWKYQPASWLAVRNMPVVVSQGRLGGQPFSAVLSVWKSFNHFSVPFFYIHLLYPRYPSLGTESLSIKRLLRPNPLRILPNMPALLQLRFDSSNIRIRLLNRPRLRLTTLSEHVRSVSFQSGSVLVAVYAAGVLVDRVFWPG